MNKHTVGPWQVIKGLYGNKDELTVWGPDSKEGTSEFVATLGNVNGHDEANAALIAAAPDLAKNLRWALAMLHVMSDKADPVTYASYRTGIQDCREALNKAKG